jgi:hypothetical protein
MKRMAPLHTASNAPSEDALARFRFSESVHEFGHEALSQ